MCVFCCQELAMLTFPTGEDKNLKARTLSVLFGINLSTVKFPNNLSPVAFASWAVEVVLLLNVNEPLFILNRISKIT
jgi:hypothetical protein